MKDKKKFGLSHKKTVPSYELEKKIEEEIRNEVILRDLKFKEQSKKIQEEKKS